jgi:hypothetical protein
MLNNVEEFGKPVRVKSDESDTTMVIPPMKLRDFTFTSLSDAGGGWAARHDAK